MFPFHISITKRLKMTMLNQKLWRASRVSLAEVHQPWLPITFCRFGGVGGCLVILYLFLEGIDRLVHIFHPPRGRGRCIPTMHLRSGDHQPPGGQNIWYTSVKIVPSFTVGNKRRTRVTTYYMYHKTTHWCISIVRTADCRCWEKNKDWCRWFYQL